MPFSTREIHELLEVTTTRPKALMLSVLRVGAGGEYWRVTTGCFAFFDGRDKIYNARCTC